MRFRFIIVPLFIVSLIGNALLGYWFFSGVFSTEKLPIDQKYVYLYDAMSQQIGYFETALAIFGFGFVILAFMGYNNVKEIAKEVAERTAKEEVRLFLEKIGKTETQAPEATQKFDNSNMSSPSKKEK